MNPLTTVKSTIISGVVLALLIGLLTMGVQINELSLIIWIHALAGITWIGLLYYFNFVQVPALAEAASDEGGPGEECSSEDHPSLLVIGQKKQWHNHIGHQERR